MNNCEKFIQNFYDMESSDDAFLVTSLPNRFYISGFHSSDGFIFATKNEVYLAVDFRYYEMAKMQVKPPLQVLLVEGRYSDTLKELVQKHNVSKLCIEDKSLTVAEFEFYKKTFPEIVFSNGSTFLENLRSVKSFDELEFIKQAQKITDSAFSHILNFISDRRTEADVALELEYFMRRSGADGIAFDTIAVSGKKSSLPHGTPSELFLQKDAFLTMDFGAKFNGYCADMTRTVVLGRANEEMKRVYDTVLCAQRLALDKIHAGVIGSDVDRSARDYIYSQGYKGCFGHSTGHGLGIEVHEMPSFSPSYNKKIEKGCVLSVEPGIYIEDKFGVRIEDIVFVTEDGHENLTKSCKELIEI